LGCVASRVPGGIGAKAQTEGGGTVFKGVELLKQLVKEGVNNKQRTRGQ